MKDASSRSSRSSSASLTGRGSGRSQITAYSAPFRRLRTRAESAASSAILEDDGLAAPAVRSKASRSMFLNLASSQRPAPRRFLAALGRETAQRDAPAPSTEEQARSGYPTRTGRLQDGRRERMRSRRCGADWQASFGANRLPARLSGTLSVQFIKSILISMVVSCNYTLGYSHIREQIL